METLLDNNHLKVQGCWNAILKLKVPNKVRVFLWSLLEVVYQLANGFKEMASNVLLVVVLVKGT